jgi:hypothetical protein
VISEDTVDFELLTREDTIDFICLSRPSISELGKDRRDNGWGMQAGHGSVVRVVLAVLMLSSSLRR